MTSDDRNVNRRSFLKGASTVGALSLLPLGSGVLLEACGTAATGASASAGKSGGTLQFGLSSYPLNFNPFASVGAATQTVLSCVYRGLLSYDSKGNLAGELATSWKSEGDTKFTFSLRPNAKFHNGDPVTADDVAFSIKYMADPKNAAYWLTTMQAVTDATAINSHTVQITLKQPNAAFLQVLADPHAPIISEKAATASPTKPPVGAGPFVFKLQEQGTKVTVTKFDGFYKSGLPELDGIDFIAYEDDNLRLTALVSGTVDMIDYVQWQSFQTITSNSRLKLASTTFGAFMYLTFNVQKPPFDNAQVRQAIGFACNRESVLKTAFFGQGQVLNGIPIVPGSQYVDSSLMNYWSYNPSKAKKMLADAGYPNGFSVNLLSTSQYGMHEDTAIAVGHALADVGIKATLQLPDWATRVAMGNSGDYDFSVMGSSGEYNDPDYLTAFLDAPTFYGASWGFSDATINNLLAEGRSTVAESDRKPIYDQIQKEAIAQSPLIPLTWRPQAFGLKKTIKGFSALPGFLVFDSMYTFDTTTLS